MLVRFTPSRHVASRGFPALLLGPGAPFAVHYDDIIIVARPDFRRMRAIETTSMYVHEYMDGITVTKSGTWVESCQRGRIGGLGRFAMDP